MSIVIESPGMLSLIQDSGRFGQHSVGLTTGGPMDDEAYYWANRILNNDANAAMIETTVGGLVVEIDVDTIIAITGATVDATLDGDAVPQWQGIRVNKGQKLSLGFATAGCRIYLAFAGGFDIAPQFGSCSTVMRESMGGIDGDKLAAGQRLQLNNVTPPSLQQLAESERPAYTDEVELDVVLGYQQQHFSEVQKALFFSSDYRVTDSCDRMGYRLDGASIPSAIEGMLSEGICLGAIQVPADGQPIVLINDRQTIGGYPKIGAVVRTDLAKLTQLMAGATIRFNPVSIEQAHNKIHLQQSRRQRTQLINLRS
ncbi:5-oxoprolinase subunit C [Sinobacterium norvegicum]|uniref:5-oxoprolinase subunit C n=1 Tax=Sinobacterium norvegicum TaxID=1641715 RepID=A0ABM9AC86_9GAMM|nr:biotin-dependent carboxyltransferase family protein [Sinobacterium norvegicum]CAH0990236.1 5-oxoprolinase subunit C [Sinobacterium norvegicum]